MNDAIGNNGRPGALLAQERIRQNLSVAEVAGKLRISIRQIEAMEADEYDKLPGVTFVRGFMRNYARLLQLDPEPLLQASGMATSTAADLTPVGGAPSQHIRLSPEPRGGGLALGASVRFIVPLLALGLLGLAAWWLWQQWSKREPASSAPQLATPQSGDSVSIPVIIPGTGAASAPAPAPATDSNGVAAGTPAVSAAAPTATVPSAAEPTAPPASIGVLRFEFTGDARIEVRDKNDFVIHEDLHKRSDITEIQVRPPVKLVIGNAKNVKMLFNGRTVDLAPHTDVSVARFTLSDPE